MIFTLNARTWSSQHIVSEQKKPPNTWACEGWSLTFKHNHFSTFSSLSLKNFVIPTSVDKKQGRGMDINIKN